MRRKVTEMTTMRIRNKYRRKSRRNTIKNDMGIICNNKKNITITIVFIPSGPFLFLTCVIFCFGRAYSQYSSSPSPVLTYLWRSLCRRRSVFWRFLSKSRSCWTCPSIFWWSAWRFSSSCREEAWWYLCLDLCSYLWSTCTPSSHLLRCLAAVIAC